MTEASSHFLDKIIWLTRQFVSISCFKGETMRTKGVIFLQIRLPSCYQNHGVKTLKKTHSQSVKITLASGHIYF